MKTKLLLVFLLFAYSSVTFALSVGETLDITPQNHREYGFDINIRDSKREPKCVVITVPVSFNGRDLSFVSLSQGVNPYKLNFYTIIYNNEYMKTKGNDFNIKLCATSKTIDKYKLHVSYKGYELTFVIGRLSQFEKIHNK